MSYQSYGCLHAASYGCLHPAPCPIAAADEYDPNNLDIFQHLTNNSIAKYFEGKVIDGEAPAMHLALFACHGLNVYVHAPPLSAHSLAGI